MAAAMVTVDGFPVPVDVRGGERGPNVVVLTAERQAPAAYDSLCQRLHVAALRTVVIGADPKLHPKAVVAILDAVEVSWAVLAGDRFGAEIAWEVAASRPERFTGLIVIDRGHPAVPDRHGVVRDRDCPPVEVNTTALASGPAARAVAKASQRLVHSDYRLVDFSLRRPPAEATAQLAAEIVLRSSSW